MQLGIVRRSPEVDAASRTRRGNAVLVESDRQIRSAQLHVVVVDQMFAIRLMLRLAFVEIFAGDWFCVWAPGLTGDRGAGRARTPGTAPFCTGRPSTSQNG